MPVKSRFLVGVGAWLLGAAAATSGSMIAVNQLAHGLLGPQQTQQLTEANLSVNPDDVSGRPIPSPTAGGVTDPPNRRSAASGRRSDVKAARTRSSTSSPSPGLTGKWLQSPDGSVLAVCQASGAYLQIWSPDQGFRADDVHRGPAPVASVTFERLGSEVILRVSCVSGTPVAQVFQDH